MKKISYYICAVVLTLGLASCAKEAAPEHPINTEGARQISVWAQIDDEATTKTALSGNDAEGYTVLWSEGDEITVADGLNSTFTLVEGAGTTRGRFVGTSEAGDGTYDVFYAVGVSTNHKNLPGTSRYNGDKVISSAPMAATITISNGEATITDFKNLCGLLRLTLKGSGTVKEIKIYAGQDLYGNFDILPDGSAVITSSPYNDYITQTCENGVSLSSTGTDFYFSLPPNDYTGVKIDVSDFAGHTFTKTLKAEKSLNIARAQITPVVFSVTGLTNDNVPLTWDSPVGTVGMLYGREAMVVNFGDGIGKLAMATMNIGASTYTEAGTFYTWYEAVQKQNNGELGGGWYLPSEPEVLAKIGYIVRKEGNVAIVDVTESSTLKIPLAGYYYNAGNKWDLVDEVAFLWSSDPAFPYNWGPSMDLATLSFYNGAMCSLNVKPQDKLNIRPFHKLPITRNTPVGMVGYLDGKDAMVVELDVNGQKKKVAVAIRNEGATNTKIYINTSNTKYLDCFGSFLTYAQAENKCTDGWYIPTIEEWQSLMANASVVEGKLAYENTFSSNDKHRAIVVNVNGNSLILPAGGPEADSNQRGWQCYYWSSTPDGSQMKCLWSRGNSISTLSSDKNSTKNTRLFHAMP